MQQQSNHKKPRLVVTLSKVPNQNLIPNLLQNKTNHVFHVSQPQILTFHMFFFQAKPTKRFRKASIYRRFTESLLQWFIDSRLLSFIDSVIFWFRGSVVRGLFHVISVASQPPFAHSFMQLTPSTIYCFCIAKTVLQAIEITYIQYFFPNVPQAGHYLTWYIR